MNGNLLSMITRLLEFRNWRRRHNEQKFLAHWKKQAVEFEAHINRLKQRRAQAMEEKCAAD